MKDKNTIKGRISRFKPSKFITAWQQYGISDDQVDNLAYIYESSDKSVELDVSSYKISMKELQYLLEIYRGRHLQAQKGTRI